MKKISYSEFVDRMWAHGKDHRNNEDYRDAITGVIVYKQSNFPKPYTEEERSYRVSSCNRCFQDGKIANSMFGDCLDGKDLGVRLDWYRWDVDFCYMDEPDVITHNGVDITVSESGTYRLTSPVNGTTRCFRDLDQAKNYIDHAEALDSLAEAMGLNAWS